MGKFIVDLDTLDQKIAEMARFDTTVDDHLRRLDETMARLHGVWSGGAADSQRRAQAEWTAGAEQMRAALKAIREAARVAHTNYTSSATTNARMWGQVR